MSDTIANRNIDLPDLIVNLQRQNEPVPPNIGVDIFLFQGVTEAGIAFSDSVTKTITGPNYYCVNTGGYDPIICGMWTCS